MDITFGAEIALSFHLPVSVSYADLEASLVDAGFTNYTIMRSVNPDNSGDVQFYVRGDRDSSGNPSSLSAGTTLTMLSEALNALEELVPDEEPPA